MDYESEMAKITVPIVFMRFTGGDEDSTLASAIYLADKFGEGTAIVEQLIGGLGRNKWVHEPEIVADRSDKLLLR